MSTSTESRTSAGTWQKVDGPVVLQHKVRELAKMVRKSKHLIAYTGTGISKHAKIAGFIPCEKNRLKKQCFLEEKEPGKRFPL